ncbi:MAG: histidine kinase [Flavobacteriales bacterium]|nr:histidine kinase [Flavobacteriales bacterium]
MPSVTRLLLILVFACSAALVQAQEQKVRSSGRSVDNGLIRMERQLNTAADLGPERVDSAFKLVESVLVWSMNNGVTALESRCYGVLGRLFTQQDQCDLATGYFEKCIEMHPDASSSVVVDAELDAALCMVRMKRYLDARTSLEALKEHVEGTKLDDRVPVINALVARILAEIGEISRANVLLEQSAELARNAGNKEAEIASNVQRGGYLFRANKKSEGMGVLKQAWAATDSIVLPEKRYKSKLDIAETMKEVGEYKEAQNFREELQQELNGTDPYTSLSNQLELADVQRLADDKSSALSTFNKVLGELPANSDDPRFLDLRTLALKNLSQTHLEVGNVQAAQRYLNEYISAMELADREKKRKLEANLGLFSSLNADVQRIRLLEKDREINGKRIELLQVQDEARAAQLFSRNAIILTLVVALVLLGGLLIYRQRARHKEQLAARLIELRSLRAQMNPHFIFNALNAVNHYIAVHDERRSNQYLTDLSGLMRKVLTYSELEFIELEDEVELLQQYLRLEYDRFQEKFTYRFHVDDSLLNAGLRVPPMLVQPFIENAIWHGLRHREGMGELTVELKYVGGHIAFTITDDGIGRARSAEIKRGSTQGTRSKGISNARNRIALVNQLYRTQVTLEITDAKSDGTGTRVHFELPKTLNDVR